MVEMSKASCGKRLQSFVGTLIQTDTNEEATVGIPGANLRDHAVSLKE